MLRFLNFLLLLVFALLIFGLGYQIGKKYDVAIDENDEYVGITYSVNEQKMRRLMSFINNYYVEDIDTDSLVDNTINYLVSHLDPHSVYLDKKVSEKAERNNNGEFRGIGIRYYNMNDTLTVTHTIVNSPNKDLFRLGDKIIAVEDSSVVGEERLDLTSLNRAKKNRLQFSVIRERDTIDFEAELSDIKFNSVELAYMLSPKIGYIKLVQFGLNSYEEFRTALLDLEAKGMETLVFDLRGNPGGMMKVAERIADEFLEKGALIVFTQNRKGEKKYRYATGRGDFEHKNLFVLIDESSASASEIIAGAIQDNDAGTIVGRRSYGKGLVQREISLGDGSKIRLTTEHYYTPTGRSIQKPYKKNMEDYDNDIFFRYRQGELQYRDSIHTVDSLAFRTPKGKVVYGGGGIIPDVFVGVDLKNKDQWYYEHFAKGENVKSIMEFALKNKALFEAMKEEDFVKSYDVSPLVNELKKELFFYKSLTPKGEKNFEVYVKAELGDILYGLATWQRIWNDNDAMLEEVMSMEKEGAER